LEPAPRSWINRLSQHERINFLVTNRLPRRWATKFVGWLSRVEHPLVFRLVFAVWQRLGGDFRLDEAKKQRFRSLHDCFTRELKEGMRPIASGRGVIVSPCDAIVGAHGRIEGTEVFQVKGFPYTLEDLFQDPTLVSKYRNGHFVTLRLKSNMYHRFHAPCDCRLDEVLYISGDTWNVNPTALRRVERLFCKNERAVLDLDIGDAQRSIALVAVAAILVASLRFGFLTEPLRLTYKGPNRIPCGRRFSKGDEIGFFEHGSTILIFATAGFSFSTTVFEGAAIRMGEPLLQEV
jgi:phosphatidylserine decarboxylase